MDGLESYEVGRTGRTDGRSACSPNNGYVAGSYNSLGSRARDLSMRAGLFPAWCATLPRARFCRHGAARSCNTPSRRRTQKKNSITRMRMSSFGLCNVRGHLFPLEISFSGPPMLATSMNALKNTHEHIHTLTHKHPLARDCFPAWLYGFFFMCLHGFRILVRTHRNSR